MTDSSIHLVPFLIFLLILQLGPKFLFGGQSEDYVFRVLDMDLSMAEIEKGLAETLRFFIMLQSAQVLFQTTDFGELTTGIRQAVPRGVKSVTRFTSIIAFILGLAYQSVPLLSSEMTAMVEVQRARGVDITKGGRRQQVKNLVRMATPLFVRTLELAKGSGLALLNYSFTPLGSRSTYHVLRLQRADLLTIVGISLCGTAAVVVKFLYPML